VPSLAGLGRVCRFSSRLAACVVVVVLVVGAATTASAWSARLLDRSDGGVVFERGETTGTIVFSLYRRASGPSGSQYADGSFDSTASGVWMFTATVKMEPDCREVAYLAGASSNWYLVWADTGAVEASTLLNTPTRSVSVSNFPTSTVVSSMPTASVVGTVAVTSINSTISLPSTLTVTPDPGTQSEGRIVGLTLVFALAIAGGEWLHRKYGA